MRGRLGEHLRRNVVGYLALFLALGGSAYAGSQIGAGDIEDDAIRSRHVKADKLNGSDIDESTLEVAEPFDVVIGNTVTDFPLLQIGELSVTATCSLADVDTVELTLEASSSGSGKQETTYSTRQGAGGTFPTTNRNAIDDTPKVILTALTGPADDAHGGGTLVYHSAAEVVTASFRFIVDYDTQNCELAGTAERADV
jgi:hypothetical protein